MTISARSRRATRPRTLLLLAIPLLLALAAVAGVLFTRPHQPSKMALPLRHVGEIALPGDGSRFDYASLDPGRGLLFIAHLGAGEVIEVGVRTGRVVRVIKALSDVHGVLVVPQLHRVYATATGDNAVAAIDEDTGQILTRTATGAYPDGLAYDPLRHTVWITNEAGGSETVIDAATGTLRGTVPLGGEAGNVAYDPGAGQILADVQGSNTLAVIDPGIRRLYVAAESGWVTTLGAHDRHLTVTGRAHLADGAHIVAEGPGAHRSYYPITHGPDGHPTLSIYEPAR